jgi:hypothetical protein
LASFEYLLSATKGDSKVKTLAAQTIPKYFHLYPAISARSYDAQLDLVEDQDILVMIVLLIFSNS